MIQTVLGPVDKHRIGFCHSHEHLFLADGQPARINPSLRIDDYSLTLKELLSFRNIGGATIVDAQPLGCGRMEQWLVRVSRDSGVNIIASTGFHKLVFYPDDHWIFSFDQDRLVDIFVDDLTVGMYVDTDRNEPRRRISHKAGVIKTAIDEERVRDSEKKWFYAAAEAALETGSPIMCHTESGEQALELADFYLERGVAPDQIILCHLDRTLDGLDIHKELAGRGIYLEYDTIGRFKYHSDEEEAQLIVQMIEWGLGDYILLGLDTTRARLKSYGGDIGLNYLMEHFIPLLRRYDVSEKHIEKMTVHNPAEAFSRKL